MLKVVRNDETSSSCWSQYPFLQSHRHDMGICKQVSYVLWCLEMVGFPNYHFIEVCRIQADPKLQVTNLIFPCNKHKAVYPLGCFLSMSWLQASFMCTRIGLQGVYFGVIFGSNCLCVGNVESIKYPQRHLGSFAKIAPCLSPPWELVVVNQTLAAFFEL